MAWTEDPVDGGRTVLSRRLLPAVALGLAALSACGTTVPQADRSRATQELGGYGLPRAVPSGGTSVPSRTQPSGSGQTTQTGSASGAYA